MNAPLYDGASSLIPSISTASDANNHVVGRIATRRWERGDDIPEAGAMVFISGVNNDVESDQHRSYRWRRCIGVTDTSKQYIFICLQSADCWPNVERLENCWIAEIVDPQ